MGRDAAKRRDKWNFNYRSRLLPGMDTLGVKRWSLVLAALAWPSLIGRGTSQFLDLRFGSGTLAQWFGSGVSQVALGTQYDGAVGLVRTLCSVDFKDYVFKVGRFWGGPALGKIS